MSNRTPEHEQRRQLLARWERRGTLSPGERSELLRLLDMGSSGDRALAGLIRRDLGEDGAREEAASPEEAASSEERVDAIMERIYEELEEGTELDEGTELEEGTEPARTESGSTGDAALDPSGPDPHEDGDRGKVLTPRVWRWSEARDRALRSIGAAAAGIALLIGAVVLAINTIGGTGPSPDGAGNTIAASSEVGSGDAGPGDAGPDTPVSEADRASGTVEGVAGAGDIPAGEVDGSSGEDDGSPATVVVRFELVAPEAGSVSLVGDFNDWSDQQHKLRDRDGDGVWEIEVPLQRGNVYTYNFLINGNEWIPDPSAVNHIDDPFGGEKSVLNL